MATIIDALVMTLNLDDTGFRQGQERTKKDTKNLTEEQKKELDKIEKQTKSALGAISNVQKGILGLFTAVAGATGIAQFLSQVNQAEAALGRLSTHTGQSTEDLHKWSNMAALVGGSAEDMQAGVSSLQQQLTDLKYKGDMGSTVTFLAQMGVAVADTNGEMRKQSDIMLDLSDRAKNMRKEDFYNLASGAGMTDSQIDLIMKGRTELEKMMIAQEENALVTKEQAEQARLLQAEWEMMKQSMFSAGVRILHDLMPIILAIAEGLKDLFNFLQKHRGIIYGFFIGLAIVMAPVLLTATLLVAKFLMLAAPIIAVSAAIGLLIDDFLTWKEGGESLFGTFYDWFDKLIDKVTGFGSLLKAIFTGDWAKVGQIITSYITGGDTVKQEGKPKTEAEKTLLDKVVDTANKTATSIKEGFEAVGTMVVGSAKMASEVQQGVQSDGGFTTKNLTAEKKKSIARVAKNIGVNPNDLAAVISFETAGSFEPNKRNPWSSATGLIQFMKGSGGTPGKYYGMSRDEFGALSFDEQMSYVERYFKERGFNGKKMRDVADTYTAVTGYGYRDVPKYNKHGKRVDPYWLNKVWDADGDGYIGKGEMVQSKDFKAHQKDYFGLKTPQAPVASNKGQAAIGGNTTSMNTTTVETHISEVKVYTAATDAQGIAKDMSGALAFNMNTYSFDSGLT